MAPVRDTQAMIRGMAPVLDPATWHFCTTQRPALADRARPHALTVFDEAEGVSLVLPRDVASELGFALDMPMRRITLTVQSALDGVGLTSAVAAALTKADIPCNVVAAYHHDHVFVPRDRAEAAMTILCDLAARAG